MGKGSGSGCGAFVHRRPQVTPVVAKPSKQPSHVVATPPKGLLNVGNTCYANAALQCLLSTALTPALLDPKAVDNFRSYSLNSALLPLPNGESLDRSNSQDSCDSKCDLKSELQSESRKESKRKKRAYRKLQHSSQWLTRELTNMTKEYTSPLVAVNHSWWMPSSSMSGVVINPANITKHPDKLSDCLRPYQQEDAHEFLRALLSTLTMNGHNTQLSSLFDGLLESAVTCIACRHSSMTRDRYMDLSLDISHSTTLSIADALDEFTKTEVLDGDNCVHCENCNEKQQVTKGLRLATAPSILVCHLKRFAFDRYGCMSRINKRVDFPQELLIGDYMSKMNKSKPPPYDLVGVLVHEGSSCDSGHYLAYVKAGGDWYKANDSVIEKVDLDVVLSQQAYVLLYEVAGLRLHTVADDKQEAKVLISIPVHSQPEVAAKVENPTVTEPVPATLSSSLVSLLCGASALNEYIMRDFCCRHDTKDEGTDLELTITDKLSLTEMASRGQVRMHRKGSSVNNLKALESHATRSYRASTLSPHRRERFNRLRSFSNSDPGVASLNNSGHASSSMPSRRAKLRSRHSPLPPRPRDYRRSSLADMVETRTPPTTTDFFSKT